MITEAEKKGKSRKYTPETKQQVIKIRKDLEKEDSYFIGSKYLKGSDSRINFLSCKYIRPEKRGITTRIEGQTTKEAITALK